MTIGLCPGTGIGIAFGQENIEIGASIGLLLGMILGMTYKK